MFYLATQTIFWLVLAFILGLLIGWLLFRNRNDQNNSAQQQQPAAQANTAPQSNHELEAAKNEIQQLKAQLTSAEQRCSDCEKRCVELQESKQSTEAPERPADDLKLISGVGPKLEGLLNGLGIKHFSQIAAFTENDIAEVNEKLSFTGRIERENWIEQAKKLAAGEETEFSQRQKQL